LAEFEKPDFPIKEERRKS